jgi:hypothetical protein
VLALRRYSRLAFGEAVVVGKQVAFNNILPFLCNISSREISSSHGGEYDVQSCLLGYTAV